MKKSAKDAIRAKMLQEQNAIRAQLRQNIWSMKKLVDQQTLLKREIAVYGELIRSLEG